MDNSLKQGNQSWIVFSEAHNAVVTSAIFAPNPGLMVSLETSEKQEAESKGEDCETSDTIPSGRCLR